MLRTMTLLMAGLLALVPIGSDAQAQAPYPNRVIKLIVGFGAGGATDTISRLLSDALAKELGQPIIVENRPGANGLRAWQSVAAAEPDGYTLLIGENALAIRPGLVRNNAQHPQFDPLTQLDGIAYFAYSPLVFVVAKKVKANNVQEMVELSRAATGGLHFASAGNGTVTHLVGEVVKDAAQIKSVNVNYQGGGPAMNDLIAGHVDFTFAAVQVAKPLVESGMIKALAVTSRERSPALPDVPTLAEAGLKPYNVDLRFWYGVFAPKGLPADVKAKIENAFQQVVASEPIRAKLTGVDVTPDFAPGAALQERLATEIENWASFISSRGLALQ